MIARLALGASAAWLAVLGAVGVDHAQDTPPRDRAHPHRLIGIVTEVGEDSFEIKTRRGREITVAVDEATTYRDVSGEPLTLSDLTPGMRVGVKIERGPDGPLARHVILLPECKPKEQ